MMRDLTHGSNPHGDCCATDPRPATAGTSRPRGVFGFEFPARSAAENGHQCCRHSGKRNEARAKIRRCRRGRHSHKTREHFSAPEIALASPTVTLRSRLQTRVPLGVCSPGPRSCSIGNGSLGLYSRSFVSSGAKTKCWLISLTIAGVFP